MMDGHELHFIQIVQEWARVTTLARGMTMPPWKERERHAAFFSYFDIFVCVMQKYKGKCSMKQRAECDKQ